MAGQAKDKVQHFASDTADTVGHAKDKVVDWASDAAHYTGDTLGNATDQATTLIRRYPIASLCVGLGVGFMLARLTSAMCSTSRSSY